MIRSDVVPPYTSTLKILPPCVREIVDKFICILLLFTKINSISLFSWKIRWRTFLSWVMGSIYYTSGSRFEFPVYQNWSTLAFYATDWFWLVEVGQSIRKTWKDFSPSKRNFSKCRKWTKNESSSRNFYFNVSANHRVHVCTIFYHTSWELWISSQPCRHRFSELKESEFMTHSF